MVIGDPVQPTVTSADGRREFDCFPAAILGFIVNARNETLLLAHPERKNGWEVVNGAIKAGESPFDALVRETHEEAGPDVSISPVAAFHTFLYRFDEKVRAMLSIAYVATYEGGDVVPGDDMALSEHRWASLDEIESGELSVLVPAQTWLFRRAVTVHSLLKEDRVELEPWQRSEPTFGGHPTRSIAAVLFTDLVESTRTAVRLGDRAFIELLQTHERAIARTTSASGGRIVKSTGDGVLALFPSVVAAVSAAQAIQREARAIGLAVRAGIHLGEVTTISLDVAGQGVVVAARLCAIAGEDEVLVSRTAADLLAGSGISIEPRGAHDLKGLGSQDVFAARANT